MPDTHTQAKLLNDAVFGVKFFTSSQRQEACGTNGLPLTPNSIRILGKSKALLSISHPNICEYIDIIRGKHERIIIVSEYHTKTLQSILLQNKEFLRDTNNLLRIVIDVLKGLTYLNQLEMICSNLSLESIVLDKDTNAKLFNYGLYHITNRGKYVSFPIGIPKYMAPELLMSGVKKGLSLVSTDIWSLGIILIELALCESIWSDLKLPQIIRKVSSLSLCENEVIQRILQEHHSLHVLKELDPTIKAILEKCLCVNPLDRPTPQALLEMITQMQTSPLTTNCVNNHGPISSYDPLKKVKLNFLKSSALSLPSRSCEISSKTTLSTNFGSNVDHLSLRSLKEIYHFWQLAGGDVISELKRQGLTRKKPAVLSLPNSMTLAGKYVGKSKERGLLLDNTTIVLPLSELKKRLSNIPLEVYYPLIAVKTPDFSLDWASAGKEARDLPLVIREKDIEYQFHRIVLFDRLIKGYPSTRKLIRKESLIDIPPFFRAQVWSCLLGIQGDIESTYEGIDKETPTSTDRQIEVDIPRCHQYDELLSSPSGHEKFKRVLKAWVVSNKEYVYWQGLDSLSAPFLYLNFNNEAAAFHCLSAFIPKYLYHFFLKDNSAIIQEYLAKFSQLIAFHDPQLTNHLDSIGFIPELYAIPWFLTMFSHVFPLHKIFHLWDKLLLGDSSFPLCIGLAILYQLREGLLNAGFNECILLFSDMPEINIEKCVTDSVEIYCSTPKSVFCRKHEPPPIIKSTDIVNKFNHRRNLKNNYETLDSSGRQISSLTNEALKMEAISLDDLKSEKCARISGEDVLRLLNFKTVKQKLLVIDVRNKEDYNRGAIPGSINMPFMTAFTPNETLVQSEEFSMLNSNRGKILVIVGNRGDSATKFGEKLLRLGYPRICILHRGIDIFRSGHNILAVPSTL